MRLRLLRFELLWIALLAPAVLLPGRIVPLAYHAAAVIALFLFWPLRLAITGRLSILSPVNWCMAVLLAWMPVALWVAPNAARAWEVGGYILFGMALAAALVNSPFVQRRPQAIAWALLATGTGLALLGPLVVTEGTPVDAQLRPVQAAFRPLTAALGETINPNVLAGGLQMAFPFAVAGALFGGWAGPGRQRDTWARAGLALLASVMAGAVWLAGSRATLLAVAVILLLLAVFRWRRLAWSLPLLAAGVAALLALRWNEVVGALGANGLRGASGATSVVGLADRLQIWARALQLIYDFPLTGVGLGAFAQIVPLFSPYFGIPAWVDIPDAHQLLLQVGIDLGLPGLVVFTALLLCLFVMLGIALRRSLPLDKWLAAGALGALAGTLATGLFNAVNWGSKPTFLFWLVAALAVLLYRKATAEGAEGA